jgi:selenide,water dikinase
LEGIGGGGISMDCSVEPTRHAGVWNITTTDFFFPLVEDPYLQGRIGCCNVLSDLYAMGVTDCDNMLMLVAASLDMPADLRLVCTGHMMRGFNDVAVSAGTKARVALRVTPPPSFLTRFF